MTIRLTRLLFGLTSSPTSQLRMLRLWPFRSRTVWRSVRSSVRWQWEDTIWSFDAIGWVHFGWLTHRNHTSWVGEIVRHANIGIKKYDKTPRPCGENYPHLLVPVQRFDRVEAWEEWVEEEADSKEVLRVMRGTSKGILAKCIHAREDELESSFKQL